MALDVIERMSKFSLLEDEEEEEEEDTIINDHVREKAIKLCSNSLIGKLLTDKSYNVMAMKETFKGVWNAGNEIKIVDVGDNLFQIRCNSEFCMQRILSGGPWCFNNRMLLVRKWEEGTKPDTTRFDTADFWIQIWGLPFEYLSKEIAVVVGRKVGELLRCDDSPKSDERGKYFRVWVHIQIGKPLKRWGNLVMRGNQRAQVTYKYERLPLFCFYCGHLAHEDRRCNIKWEDEKNNCVHDDEYSPWLWAFLAPWGWGQGRSMDMKFIDSGGSSWEKEEEVESSRRYSGRRPGSAADESRRALKESLNSRKPDKEGGRASCPIDVDDGALISLNGRTCRVGGATGRGRR